MAFDHESPHKGATDEWFTPKWIIDRLGPFDLDPCTSLFRPWDTAATHYCGEEVDGLSLPWKGRVWLNPPYGPQMGKWVNKLAEHGNGIALIFARTETRAFQDFSTAAHGILFPAGRYNFCKPHTGEASKSNAGSPSCFIAFGDENWECLETSGIKGFFCKSPYKVGETGKVRIVKRLEPYLT